MAVDMFLKIDGVIGESGDTTHKGEIEILSWSWGASNPGAASSGGGGGTGKVSFQDLHFMKQLDKSSPLLFLACASGQHFQKAQLTCRKSGGGQSEFFYIKMEDVLVSSFSVGDHPTDDGFSNLPPDGGSSGLPMDAISLNFTKIEFDYKPSNAALASSTYWDLRTNTGGPPPPTG